MHWYKNQDQINLERYKNSEIYINDENIYPCWIDKRVKYSEFHVRENNQNILINIGESWTYGENVFDIASGLEKYNLNTQLNYTLGPIMSRLLNVDLYQYAIPGNSNGNMTKELARILEYVKQNFDYDKIYVSMQMTEPSREHAQLNEFTADHPIHTLYQKNQKISFKRWLERYDEMFLDLLFDETSKYDNVDCLVWKNFCKWNSDKQLDRIKKVEKNWIAKSAQYLNVDYDPISFQSIGWFNELYKNRKFYKLKFDLEWCDKEIEKITKSNKFLSANELHSMHPNHKAHKIWANFLVKQSGWLNE